MARGFGPLVAAGRAEAQGRPAASPPLGEFSRPGPPAHADARPVHSIRRGTAEEAANEGAGDPWDLSSARLAQDSRLEAAMLEVFRAYDMDDSGAVSFKEFLQIEIRMALELGDARRIASAQAQMSIANRLHAGGSAGSKTEMSFKEFVRCRLDAYITQMDQEPQPWVLSRRELASKAREEAARTMEIRTRMGLRYNAAVRAGLSNLFRLINVSGGPGITPWEWTLGRRMLKHCSPELLDRWITPNNFASVDTDKDGYMQLCEFFEVSLAVLSEAYENDAEAIVAMLGNVNCGGTLCIPEQVGFTNSVRVYLQPHEGRRAPHFCTPQETWRWNDQGVGIFERRPDMLLPASHPEPEGAAEELLSLLGLHLRIPSGCLFDAFLAGGEGGGADSDSGDHRRPLLLAPGADCGEELARRLAAGAAGHAIYVKNFRDAPKALAEEEPEQVQGRTDLRGLLTGQLWCLDWQVHTSSSRRPLPDEPLLAPGDALVITVPSNVCGEGTDVEVVPYPIGYKVYMEGSSVLSKPIFVPAGWKFEDVLRGYKKEMSRGTLAAARLYAHRQNERITRSDRRKMPSKRRVTLKSFKSGDPQGEESRLIFVALGEGTCRLFVEFGWESQEASLAQDRGMERPCSDLSVVRLGPLAPVVRAPASEVRGRPARQAPKAPARPASPPRPASVPAPATAPAPARPTSPARDPIPEKRQGPPVWWNGQHWSLGHPRLGKRAPSPPAPSPPERSPSAPKRPPKRSAARPAARLAGAEAQARQGAEQAPAADAAPQPSQRSPEDVRRSLEALRLRMQAELLQKQDDPPKVIVVNRAVPESLTTTAERLGPCGSDKQEEEGDLWSRWGRGRGGAKVEPTGSQAKDMDRREPESESVGRPTTEAPSPSDRAPAEFPAAQWEAALPGPPRRARAWHRWMVGGATMAITPAPDGSPQSPMVAAGPPNARPRGLRCRRPTSSPSRRPGGSPRARPRPPAGGVPTRRTRSEPGPSADSRGRCLSAGAALQDTWLATQAAPCWRAWGRLACTSTPRDC